MITLITIFAVTSVVLMLLLLLTFKLFKTNVYFQIVKENPLPYGLIVTNTDYNDKKKAVLFGSNEHLLTPNFGSDIPMTIHPEQTNVSYLEVIQQSAHQPFVTRMIKFCGKIKDINDIILNINTRNANGESFTFPLIIKEYIDEKKYDFNDNENIQTVEFKYKAIVDGNTKISFELKAQSKVRVYLYFNTIQYTVMGVMGYIKNLIKGNLPNKDYYKVNSPMSPQFTSLV